MRGRGVITKNEEHMKTCMKKQGLIVSVYLYNETTFSLVLERSLYCKQ
jgi:hypothetical protein